MRKIFAANIMLLFLLSSCIKEKYVVEVSDNTNRVLVEFTDGRNDINSLALDFSDAFIDVDLTEIQIPMRSAVTGTVQVKIVQNNTLLADYNTANGTAYLPPPTASYQLLTTDFSFTPSSKKSKVKLKIKPSAITGGSYAIGLSISQTSAGEINSAAKDVLVTVQVKNDYEGDYHATGLRTNYLGTTNTSGVAATFDVDHDKYLSTIDLTTVETDIADLIGGGYMYLKINPTTNAVTVSPSLFPPTFTIVTNNGPCNYDPATKTFHLNYKYFNAAGNLREITETIEAY